MKKSDALPGLECVVRDPTQSDDNAAATTTAANVAPPRLRRVDRHQVRMETYCLDDRLAADHRARLVWDVVRRLDVSGFMESIAARGSDPGRAATDPQILIALWLFATMDNVGSARRLARLCEEHDAYRWLCGGVSLNYHTLSNFRVEHERMLDGLLTQVITSLIELGLVKIDRISQDGLRVRASAGKSSFRRRKTLERLKNEVESDVKRLKRQREDPDDPRSSSQRAAQERAARERGERITRALELLPELEAIKTHQTGKPSKHREARVSTTDPEVRRMKRGDGSIGPAYNLQFAIDVESRAAVGVSVAIEGDDRSQSEPMREQIRQRTGQSVKEHLYDGGYVKKTLIESASKENVTIYAPLPANNDGEPCTQHRGDTPGVKAWRERMMTDQAKEIYKQRASTAETINADVATHRTLRSLNVRGPTKVRCVALWAILSYNLLHFGSFLVPS
jgi:transposase